MRSVRPPWGATTVLVGLVFPACAFAAPLPRLVDLAAPPGAEASPVLRVFGEDAGDRLGSAVAFGDFNADGAHDLLVGAPGAAPGGRVGAGAAAIVWGGPALPPAIDLNTGGAISPAGEARILGGAAGGHLGAAVAAGDVNGDGIDDALLGAPDGGAGTVVVIFGAANLPASVLDLSTPPGTHGEVRILGDDEGDTAGAALTAADVNADGFADIAIGAPRATVPAGSAGAGEVYIIYGAPSLPGVIDLNTDGEISPAQETRILGAGAGDALGAALGQGDVDADGFADIVLGAPGASPAGGAGAGVAIVIYGDDVPPATVIDLSGPSGAAGETRILGDDAGDRLGASVAVGDFTGDGRGDVAAGAPGASIGGRTGSGLTFIVYSGAGFAGTVIDLDTDDLISPANETRLLGAAAGDGLGSALAFSDANGDGLAGVFAGAASADVAAGGDGGWLAGIYASAFRAGNFADLAASAEDVRVLGAASGDRLGATGIAAGDLNSDGFEDFAMGAPAGLSPLPGSPGRAGYVAVVFGAGDATTATVRRGSRIGDGPGNAPIPPLPFGPVGRATIDFSDDDVSASGGGQSPLSTIVVRRQPAFTYAPLLFTPEAEWEFTTARQNADPARVILQGLGAGAPGPWPGLALVTDDGGATWYAPAQTRDEGRRRIVLDTQSFPRTAALITSPIEGAPRVIGALLTDRDQSGGVTAGDVVSLVMDQSVVVRPGLITPVSFSVPVQGDSLGFSGFSVAGNAFNARLIDITLGVGAALTVAGAFASTEIAPDSPSGIDIRAGLPPTAIQSVAGVPALPGDGVDIVFPLIGRGGTVGPEGQSLTVTDSPDAAYTGHVCSIPAGALPASFAWGMRTPPENLGIPSAVQITLDAAQSAAAQGGDVTFAVPATLTLQYLDSDFDQERGQVEATMRICQVVEGPPGLFACVPVAGEQAVDPVANTVRVSLRSLNPQGSSGEVGIFATLPVNPVEERSILIRPGAGAARLQGPPTLAPGASGLYAQHAVEFPGFALAGATDPDRRQITMRSATIFERVSLTGGGSFPTTSGALFVIETRSATGALTAFAEPVHITVEFRRGAGSDDVVGFDGVSRDPTQLVLVRDVLDGAGVDFQPLAGGASPALSLSPSGGTLRVTDVHGLTGPSGRGAWGAVAVGAPLTLPERIVNHLLGLSASDQGLQQNGDGVLDVADLVLSLTP